jgi:hypothetical protein
MTLANMYPRVHWGWIRRGVESGRPENAIVGEHILGPKVRTSLLASDRRAAFACDRERRLVSQEGIAHRGELEERSRVTESGLCQTNRAQARLVTQTFTSWNQMAGWLLLLDGLRGPA